MSYHYSKFMLNSYCATPYFQAHIPEGYPVGIILQRCRAFRRLPPNLKQLATLAKRWSLRVYGKIGGTERGYDDEGYELNPNTGGRLTDEEIDAQWGDFLKEDQSPIKDIPIPPGGFADPDTWEEPESEPEEPDEYDGPTEKQLLNDIRARGRGYTAKYYGVPGDALEGAETDEEAAQAMWEVVRTRFPNAPENRP